MTAGKALRSLAAGFVIAILAVGLLPFLILYNVAELPGTAEFELSPVLLLVSRFVNGSGKDKKAGTETDGSESPRP